MAADWNLLLYAVAQDRAELTNVMQAIDDMHGALQTARCNIAVQLHTRSKTTRYWISAGARTRVDVLPVIADASDPASLTSFLNTADRMFPSTSSALVLWAHGSGMSYAQNTQEPAPRLQQLAAASSGDIRFALAGYGCGWGPDPHTKRLLRSADLKTAIAASTRRRVDVLGLNACWMASLEVGYELRKIARVQVASQVKATPWPYGALVAELSAKPAMSADDLATTIVASVRSELAHGKRCDAVSAYLSDPAMNEVASAFEVYAKRVTTLIETQWESVLNAVILEAQRVDDDYQVDLMSLIHHLGKHDPKAELAAAGVDVALRAASVAHAADHAQHPGVHGLSIFCPKTSHVDLADAYKGTAFRAHGWTTFLHAFQAKLART